MIDGSNRADFLSIRQVVKEFDDVTAVDRVSFDVQEGSFTCLLGPSGCGKTTTLRMIAGFMSPDAGDIVVDGESVLHLPPNRRPTSIVFQDYALFPHMTVKSNVSYGLRAQRVPSEQARDRLDRTLDLLGLTGLEDRYPQQLSGGQQQRVALARSLVTEPKVLLMDEPLSNLDAKLRVKLRADLRALQRDLGITTVYVTHDQEEALAMSDRVAVMRDGRIEQAGEPRDLYFEPVSLFVAEFIGLNNLIPVTVGEEGSRGVRLRLSDDQELEGRGRGVEAAGGLASGGTATAAIRPEMLTLSETPSEGALVGKIRNVEFLGTSERYSVLVAGNALIADRPASRSTDRFAPGAEIFLTVDPSDVHVMPQAPTEIDTELGAIATA